MSKQRVKGNKHPSSSSNAFSSILKFTNLPEAYNLNSYTDVTGDSNHEIFLAIKKCYKKDFITKKKGLQEILNLFEECEEKEYDFLLNQWIRVFLDLINDTDINVIEFTLTTFKNINKIIKDHLDKHLEKVLPFWLILGGYPHGNVSKIASNSLVSTFGKEKLIEVILNYKEQIIQKLNQVLEDKKKDSNLILGSFYIILTLSKVSSDNYVNEHLNKVFNNSIFWNFSKHKDNNVVKGLCGTIEFLLNLDFVKKNQNFIKNVIQVLVDNLSIKNIQIKEKVWKIMFKLMILNKNNTFNEIPFEKFYQSLLDIFETYSDFNQEIISLNVPIIWDYLLIKNSNKVIFTNDMFDYLKTLIDKKLNLNLIFTFYFDSILYLIKQETNLKDQGLNAEFINNLILNNLYLLNDSFSDKEKSSNVFLIHLTNFNKNLCANNFHDQNLLTKKLMVKILIKYLKSELNGEFDFKFMKNSYTTILNSKSNENKYKLDFFEVSKINENQFINYNISYMGLKEDLFKNKITLEKTLEILITNNKRTTHNYFDFLNFLVHIFYNYEDETVAKSFIELIMLLNNLILDENTELSLKLCYIIYKVLLYLKNDTHKSFLNQISTIQPRFFIPVLQLFNKHKNIQKLIDNENFFLNSHDYLYENLQSSIVLKYSSIDNHRFLNFIEDLKFKVQENNDILHDDTKESQIFFNYFKENFLLSPELVELINEKPILDYLNSIFSFLKTDMKNSFYSEIFNKLSNSNLNYPENKVLIYLVIKKLHNDNKVFPIDVIENLIFSLLEIASEKFYFSIESGNNFLWSLYCQKILKKETKEKIKKFLKSLSSKLKHFFEKKLSYENTNFFLLNIVIFIKDLIENEICSKDDIDEFVQDLIFTEKEILKFDDKSDKRILNFLYIKGFLIEDSFLKDTSFNCDSYEIEIPSYVYLIYTSLFFKNIFDYNVLKFIKDFNFLLDDQFKKDVFLPLICFFEKNLSSNNNYLINYANKSLSYLKILEQVDSYSLISIKQSKDISKYMKFFEFVYSKIDSNILTTHVKTSYDYSEKNIWFNLNLYFILRAASVSEFLKLDEVSNKHITNNLCLLKDFIIKDELEKFLQMTIKNEFLEKVYDQNKLFDFRSNLNIVKIGLYHTKISLDFEDYILPILETLINYNENKCLVNKLFIYNFDELDEKNIYFIISIIEFLNISLARYFKKFDTKIFIGIFQLITKWTESFNLENILKLVENRIYSCYLNRLFVTISNLSYILKLLAVNENKLHLTWSENYSCKINERFFKILCKLSEQDVSFVVFDLLNNLGKCLISNNKNLLKIHLDKKIKKKNSTLTPNLILFKISTNHQKIFDALQELFLKKTSTLLLITNKLFSKCLKELAELSNDDQAFLQALEDKLYLEPPNFVINIMYQVEESLNNSNSFEETIKLRIMFFLIWKKFIKFWEKLNDNSKFLINNYLKEYKLLDNLFKHFFLTLPIDEDFFLFSYENRDLKSMLSNYFNDKMDIDETNIWTKETMYHLACEVYLKIFQKMPTTMRLYINASPFQNKIKQFTSKYVSRIIIENEFKVLKNKSETVYDNLSFKIRESHNEVSAFYSIEDIKIELGLTLPTNYPIDLIKINVGEKIGVDLAKWKTWELQLTTFLSQNGSVFEGILLWIDNIKKAFEGVDECTICYYIFQSFSHQLPKISCKNCTKKFHSNCLSKWFQKSNRKTCPLCRMDMKI